jgi:hypothetical protein
MPLIHLDPSYESKIRRARAMDPEDKLLEGPRLFAGALERMKDGIRDQFPEADEKRVQEIVLERLALLKRTTQVR